MFKKENDLLVELESARLPRGSIPDVYISALDTTSLAHNMARATPSWALALSLKVGSGKWAVGGPTSGARENALCNPREE